jgi:hypothetical protein
MEKQKNLRLQEMGVDLLCMIKKGRGRKRIATAIIK